ncbi:hypothetical protein F511_37260 [Dorcoceras hygrometricum]|uniref:Uncharacterized protein n=1 Tax=Dorcoceras hygrometricum TaxID=472368 RepID=A0A2Z7BYH0_9LAMI|nr:hypothetical protein F511_37260 [Dorcoceras hygrometricum]
MRKTCTQPRHVSAERASKLTHQLSPSINTARFAPLYSFTHSCTLLHTVIFALALARTSSDLSIGGASPDTLPAPSDECLVVADIRTYSPVPDTRRARGPRRGLSSSAELFGYINWRRL